MLPSIRKLVVKDPELSRVQDAILLTLNTIVKKDVIDGVLGEGFAITTSPAQIAHGLGRVPLGYFVVSKDAPSDIFDLARDSKTITLQATADVTVSLWIF